MNTENKEIIELMRVNGVPKDIAQLLLALQNFGGLTQDDITEHTGLRQPSVSIAVAWAYKRKWVKLKIIRKNRTGRPKYCYSLAKDFQTIVEEIAQERAQEIACMMNDLKKLKATAI
jgi:predicted transcriptional regulator